jgi:DNA-binding XRE family transcriptional regulator
MRKTSSASKIIHKRFYAGQPQRLGEYESTKRQMALGMKIQRLREQAGMTQQQLADRIGTHKSAISRIEDADYDGHSITTLAKIAKALDMRLIVDFEDKSPQKRAKSV